jgi:hypothetical protein
MQACRDGSRHSKPNVGVRRKVAKKAAGTISPQRQPSPNPARAEAAPA